MDRVWHATRHCRDDDAEKLASAASDGASVASAHSGQQDADAGPGGCQRGMRIVPDPASAADIALGLRRFRPSRRAEETLSMCLR
jgi:hypothetical protein